jgi:hypothetical protein
MKRFSFLILALLMLTSLFLTSCSAKTVTVRVLDAEGNAVCEETVTLGEAFEEGVHDGVVYYGIDCLEVALKQAGIEYFVNKEDYEAFVVTNIGDIAADRQNQFGYYVKEKKATEFEDRNGLTAQHDEMVGGETLEFRFEAIKTTENK